MTYTPGNQIAKDGKRWKAAILRALSRAAGNVDAGLDKLASTIVNKAMHGDRWAMDHIADRVDGKPVPAFEGDAIPVTVVRVEFVTVEPRLTYLPNPEPREKSLLTMSEDNMKMAQRPESE